MFFGLGRKKQEALADKMEQEGNQDYWSIVRAQFKKNILAVWSLRIFYVILFIAIFTDFIANEKPIYCVMKAMDDERNYIVEKNPTTGEMDTATVTYWPIFRQYMIDLGLAKEWSPRFKIKKWHEHGEDYVTAFFPPITYSSGTLDKKNIHYKSPFDDQQPKNKKAKLKTYRGWHYLGTDNLGRDVASGMVHGTRTAMLVGIVSMSIALLIGIFLGALSGYFGDDRLKVSRIRIALNIVAFVVFVFYGFIIRSYAFSDGIKEGSILGQLGTTILIFFGLFGLANLLVMPLKLLKFLGKKVSIPMDILVMRFIEIVNSIPVLILILAIVAIIETPSILYVMAIIGLVSWTGIAKFIRAELLRVRRLKYIEAAQAFGYSELRIILRHAIPNGLAPVLIAAAFGIASAILTESFLSFIGVGVPAEQVTWGSLLSLSRGNPSAWWLAVFPGSAIFITVTIFNLLGEGLTDALNPKLKE